MYSSLGEETSKLHISPRIIILLDHTFDGDGGHVGRLYIFDESSNDRPPKSRGILTRALKDHVLLVLLLMVPVRFIPSTEYEQAAIVPHYAHSE